MVIKKITGNFTIMKVKDYSCVNISMPFVFTGATNNEYSLVCPEQSAPLFGVISREDGWALYRIEGQLDFKLIGIIAEISGVLARAEVSIFAISTFDTDYFLIKNNKSSIAEEALSARGYKVI